MAEVLAVIWCVLAGLVIIGCVVVLVVFLLSGAHYNKVWENYNKITDAIHSYRMDMLKYSSTIEVDYEDMEDISIALKRFWDWSYKRILPPEKYAIIEKYIDE